MSAMQRRFARGMWCAVTATVITVTTGLSAAGQECIIIDHKCTKLQAVPVSWIDQAKTEFFLSYGHTSHGSQITSGIANLNSVLGCSCGSCSDAGCGTCQHAYCNDYNYYAHGSGTQAPPDVLSFWDYRPLGASDLGNPNRTAWEAATRAMLEDSDLSNRNLVMWSWCGQADTTEENMQLYLDLMSGLEDDYDEVTFVYMTGHLNGTGEEGNLFQRNNQIRDHVRANGGVLFDFADLESYDPDWDYFRDLHATDTCDYDGGNWADEWCAEHPGSDLCVSCSCAHSRPLNCNLKARAFWWMMARLAGWEGTLQTDYDHDGDVDLVDLRTFSQCLAGPGAAPLPPTPPVTEADCLQSFDTDGDLDVDLDDFDVFQVTFNGA